MKRLYVCLLFALCVLAFLSFPNESQALKTWTYGNYCGKGKGHGKPVDRVDAACKQHDECCVARGTIQATIWGFCNCQCDKRFIQQVKSALRKSKSAKERKAGKQILFYVKNTFCHCGKKQVCSYSMKCSKKRVCRKIAGKKRCATKPVCKKVKTCKMLWRMGSAGGKCMVGKKWIQTLKRFNLYK